MKILNLLASGDCGGIESLCNNIDKFSDMDNYWVFLFQGGVIQEEMEKRNPLKVYKLFYKKYNLYKYIKEINEICKKEKIDIINIHHGGTYCNIIYTILKKKNSNIKFVRTIHSCYEDKYYLEKNDLKNKLILYFLNKALQESDLIIFVSNAVKKSFEEKFELTEKNRIVIYNGIPNNFFDLPQIERKNKKIKDIVYIGRLEKAKGVDILIDAFSKLVKENNDVNLTIVGYRKQKKRTRTTGL